jgi:hypothetical protein
MAYIDPAQFNAEMLELVDWLTEFLPQHCGELNDGVLREIFEQASSFNNYFRTLRRDARHQRIPPHHHRRMPHHPHHPQPHPRPPPRAPVPPVPSVQVPQIIPLPPSFPDDGEDIRNLMAGLETQIFPQLGQLMQAGQAGQAGGGLQVFETMLTLDDLPDWVQQAIDFTLEDDDTAQPQDGLQPEQFARLSTCKYREWLQRTAGTTGTAGTAGTADSNLPNDKLCSVCLTVLGLDQVVRVLPCHHVFHLNCIDEWLTQAATCPDCRHDVRISGTSNTSNSNSNC